MTATPLVTFDLFSALIDSRSGGSAALGELAVRRQWRVTGETLYDTWDRLNKASQKDEKTWIPFAEHSRRALNATYATYVLEGDADADTASLLKDVSQWPLWDDVQVGLVELAQRHRIGVLSNVDDTVFRDTAVAPLVDHANAITSERVGVYKPSPTIYQRARELAPGGLVHVATSARDVRGALEAGISVIRLQRPGHHLDPDGPRPQWEATSVSEVAGILDQITRTPQSWR